MALGGGEEGKEVEWVEGWMWVLVWACGLLTSG